MPNCHGYLEIWPAGLRSYNLLVPNFLNLPFLLFGSGPPKATVGLVMYSASRAAGCAYCTAHSCVFALRRGAAGDHVARVAGRQLPQDGAERSALDVAEALACVPSSLTEMQRAALRSSFSASDAEWIVLAAAMGFLAIRALTAIRACNTDPDDSPLGLRVKHLAGLVYATAVEDEEFADAARILARQAGASSAQLDETGVTLELTRAAAIRSGSHHAGSDRRGHRRAVPARDHRADRVDLGRLVTGRSGPPAPPAAAFPAAAGSPCSISCRRNRLLF